MIMDPVVNTNEISIILLVLKPKTKGLIKNVIKNHSNLQLKWLNI